MRASCSTDSAAAAAGFTGTIPALRLRFRGVVEVAEEEEDDDDDDNGEGEMGLKEEEGNGEEERTCSRIHRSSLRADVMSRHAGRRAARCGEMEWARRRSEGDRRGIQLSNLGK